LSSEGQDSNISATLQHWDYVAMVGWLYTHQTFLLACNGACTLPHTLHTTHRSMVGSLHAAITDAASNPFLCQKTMAQGSLLTTLHA
jgi:hypothetical protein